jgi:PPM family protein phosphatase
MRPAAQRAHNVKVDIGARTDLGRVRENNEDNFRVDQDLNLFVLSDGMGGVEHGEVASSIAVESVAEYCRDARNDSAITTFAQSQDHLSKRTNRLVSAVHFANAKIYDSASSSPDRHGMGATLVGVWLDGMRLSIAHVGDSRLYLLRSGSLRQVTEDHSLVAEQVRQGLMTQMEADHSPLQNVLTRALGTQPFVEVEAQEESLAPGDVLLLCSDGLTKMVQEKDIVATLNSPSSAQAAADRLIELANRGGGFDNTTVIVVCITGGS